MSLFGPRAIDITDDLMPTAIELLKKGHIFIFDRDGERFELKITKIHNGRVWAKEVKTWRPDQIAITDIKR